ncbi:ATP synthase mitochondrial F1 complex assembly factor 1 [Coccinella septempunctata]|uniref:ATP synthase mitochondrial F1 complex assembly factor 1 n=1 Tax=Coccinella septempunctata TaxID=41139 RepID=UPI001D08F097|nr:ATP synthase mitochondrial F1 complex assembly factor 1 [Coccinella septempunctata]
MVLGSARANIQFRTLLSRLSQNRGIMTTAKKAQKAVEELKQNPYFEKYAEKIAKLQQTSPEELLQRIEKKEVQQEEQKKAAERQYSQLLNPKKCTDKGRNINSESLDEYMKVEAVKDKSADEIKEIWLKYHIQKECNIAATVPKKDFEQFKEKSELYPTFLFALPRSQGYEFIMSQIEGNCVHFTPLLYFQVHKENAPECLTIKHYTEFMDEKGIVLMKGEFDSKVINSKEALCLANQLQLYYCQNNDSKNKLLEVFTKNPDEFKHMDLIKEIENLSL